MLWYNLDKSRILITESLDSIFRHTDNARRLAVDKNNISSHKTISRNNEEHIVANVKYKISAVNQLTAIYIIDLVATRSLNGNTVHTQTTHTGSNLMKHRTNRIHHFK